VAAGVLVAACLVWTSLSPSGGQPQRAFAALVVNDVPKGTALVVVDGDRIWLPVAVLEQAGLHGFEGRRDTLFGEAHVLLSSLEPDITAVFDRANVEIHVTAAPRFFAETHVELQYQRPADLIISHSPSAFINYSATWDQEAGTSGFGEAGFELFGNTSMVSAFTAYPDGVVGRGLTTLTVDAVSRRQRWQLGDIVAASTPLGSAPTLAGAAFGRDYSLDPYFYRYAAPTVRGTATAPSDVEIYVNGALVRRLPIGPGPYRLDRLPLNSGLGDVQVVVRDRLGRQQTFDSSIYLATGVLPRGEQDYQYAAGWQRDDSGETPVYTDLEATGYHRAGLTNWLTAGFEAEGREGVAAGGPTLNIRLARLGEADLHAWASDSRDGHQGLAFYGVYAFASPRLTLGATAQYYAPGFANLSLTPGSASTPEFYQASAGVPLFRIGSLNYTITAERSPAGVFGFTRPDGSFDDTIVPSGSQSLRLTLRLTRRTQLITSATRTSVRGTTQWDGFAGVNVAIGRQTTASVTYSSVPGSPPSTYASLDRPLPVGVGYGFRVTGSDLDTGTASGQFEVNTPFNHMTVTYDATQGGASQTGSATLAGGIVATRGGLFFARELDQSVAVVEIPGLKGVRIQSDNVDVGRTNGGGRLLVPRLLPYLANRISLSEADIPFAYSVPVTAQFVAPAFRGAAYVKFATARVQGRVGSIRMTIDGEEVVPAFGAIVVEVEGRRVESPLNADGTFFLDLPDGHHMATVTYKGRSCEVELNAIATSALVQQLGTLRCGS
jgi:outer membrane usher protein